jgi:guanine deaminase
MDEAYKILQLRDQILSPLRSFYMMTLGNAKTLSLSDKIGTLDVGTEADITVLNAQATPAMKLRYETVSSLSEELFMLQTMGDDRAISAVYVSGQPSHPGH